MAKKSLNDSRASGSRSLKLNIAESGSANMLFAVRKSKKKPDAKKGPIRGATGNDAPLFEVTDALAQSEYDKKKATDKLAKREMRGSKPAQLGAPERLCIALEKSAPFHPNRGCNVVSFDVYDGNWRRGNDEAIIKATFNVNITDAVSDAAMPPRPPAFGDIDKLANPIQVCAKPCAHILRTY